MAEEEVSNKQIILRDYVSGFPKESDMIFKVTIVKLKVPEGSNAILMKNLYLSCDPAMRFRMKKMEGSYVDSFVPGSAVVDHGITSTVLGDGFVFEQFLKYCVTTIIL
ncbi:unnamed protein product [Ilex paraguariensis]|uniref:Oxidoreductase N-terminal domain-containing protein n=1 Tax=Ilex paraguariensis TaxID=185542 RepID=A0ABC8RXC7_9AQUA